MAEQSLRSMVEAWSRDPAALQDLIEAPKATADRFGLSPKELAALRSADLLRVPRAQAAAQPAVQAPPPADQAERVRASDTLSTMSVTGSSSGGGGGGGTTLSTMTVTGSSSGGGGGGGTTLSTMTVTGSSSGGGGGGGTTLSTMTVTGSSSGGGGGGGGSSMTFETGSTITGGGGGGGGSSMTFETGSTITGGGGGGGGGSSLTFETGSTITGGGGGGGGSSMTFTTGSTITGGGGGGGGGSSLTFETGSTITGGGGGGGGGSGSTMTFVTGSTITGGGGGGGQTTGSTITFVTGTTITGGGGGGGGQFVRRDVWGLMPNNTWHPVVEHYARAVAVMQSRPASDHTSWTWQAAIHGSHDSVPSGARWNECQHRQWYFLPWHRMYLQRFEQIVRAIVISNGGPSDWALPYWNYDQAAPRNTMPLAFRAATLPDGSANPLHVPAPGRDPSWDLGGNVPTAASSSTAAMAATSYTGVGGAGFGGGQSGPAHFGGSTGAVEQTPHNVIHPLIGGTAGDGNSCSGAGLMTDPDCAALDPIFWLHHANIDRIWNRWLAQSGRANPTDASWLSQQFTLYDANGSEISGPVSGVVDSSSQLGYVYDDQPTSDVPVTPVPTPPEPQRPPELAGATEQPVELVGRPVSVQLAMPQGIQLVQGDEGGGGRHLYLSVEDIVADKDPRIPYAVYMEPARGGGSRQHVGNITLFGLDKMNDPDREHDGPPGWRHTFEVTSAVNQLASQGQWDPNSVQLTFEPLRPGLPPGVHLPQGDEPGERPPVRIGRVSMFVAES